MRLVGPALLVLAASGGLVGVARAHALLLRSAPAADAEMTQPPPAIELYFTEALEPGFSTARLLNSSGAEVETGAVVLDPTDPTHLSLPLGQLPPGLYTIAWQTLSQVDGHEWYGSFPFTVLNADGSRPAGTAAGVEGAGRGELPTPAEVVFRWLALVGALFFFGAALFRLLAGPEAGRGRPAPDLALAAAVSALAVPALWLAAGLLVLGNWGQLVVQALRLGGWESLPAVVLDTRTGLLALARQAPALVGLCVAACLPRSEAARRGQPGRKLRLGLAAAGVVLAGLLAWAALPDHWPVLAGVLALVVAGLALARRGWAWPALALLGAGALLGYTANSHAAAVSGRAWAMLGDYVHLAAAGAWLGGLLLLPWLLLRQRSQAGVEARQALWRQARRYSYLASFSVFVLAVSGLFNSLVELSDLASLFTTTYGRVLLAKLAVLGVALGLALLNNRLLHGRRQRQAEAGQAQALQRQTMTESAVALGLMLTVAVLVQTPPPRFVAPAAASAALPQLPFNTTLTADDLFIHAQVTPNQVGANRFWLHLYHETGTSVGEVQLVRLLFDYRDAQLGQASVDLESLDRATFQSEGAYLSQAGSWDVSIYVRRRGLDDTLAQFRLEVPAPAGLTAASAPWVSPVAAVPGLALAAVALIAAGLAPFIWRRPLEDAGPRLLSIATLAGLVTLTVGLGLAVAAAPAWRERLLAQQAATRTNPIPDTPESRAQGQALYQENCLPCHGPTGLGDGPVGLTLRPAPANLQVHMVPGVHSDAQIYDWISNGFPNAPMPAFGEALTEEQIWHLMNYIRTLVPPEA